MGQPTYLWSRFIVKRTGHVDDSGRVLHGKCIAYVTACDLVSNIRRCKRERKKEKIIK